MEKVIIYGNGKIAKIIYHFLKKQFDVVAFTVDKQYIQNNILEGLPVVAFENVQKNYKIDIYKMLIAIGYVEMNSIREKKYLEAKKLGYKFINYIHPSVHIHDNIEIGENNIILDHVTIQPYTQIGNSNFLWSNSVVAHGSKIQNTNWITSGVVISGDTNIKSKCFLGVNSSVGHNITIENETFIGANTLVTRSSKEKEVFISNDGQKFRLDSQKFLQFTGV